MVILIEKLILHGVLSASPQKEAFLNWVAFPSTFISSMTLTLRLSAPSSDDFPKTAPNTYLRKATKYDTCVETIGTWGIEEVENESKKLGKKGKQRVE